MDALVDNWMTLETFIEPIAETAFGTTMNEVNKVADNGHDVLNLFLNILAYQLTKFLEPMELDVQHHFLRKFNKTMQENVNHNGANPSSISH